MTDHDHLTPRSQAVWSAELETHAADRAELARRTGVSRNMLARMLTCRSRVTGSQARALAEAAGLRCVPRSLHGFTMEAQP